MKDKTLKDKILLIELSKKLTEIGESAAIVNENYIIMMVSIETNKTDLLYFIKDKKLENATMYVILETRCSFNQVLQGQREQAKNFADMDILIEEIGGKNEIFFFKGINTIKAINKYVDKHGAENEVIIKKITNVLEDRLIDKSIHTGTDSSTQKI